MDSSPVRATPAQADVKVGVWLVRPSLNEISAHGIARRLRPGLMDILVLLASRAGQVVQLDCPCCSRVASI
ncbi:MAG: hypothetical protein NT090_07610 [Acidobacteria bacterium]|nr:hypothetical protein [Acidobacteriota bacterium]